MGELTLAFVIAGFIFFWGLAVYRWRNHWLRFDDIERLTAEIEHLKSELETSQEVVAEYVDEIERLTARIAELEGALDQEVSDERRVLRVGAEDQRDG